MRRIKKHWGVVFVVAALLVMPAAGPAASQEDDRPQNYEAPSPTDTTGTMDQTTTDASAASATFDDFVRITNPDAAGDAEIRLDGSAGDGSTQWDLENDATSGNQLQFLHGFGTPQMTLTPSGFLGLGTTSPQDQVHLANTGNDHLLLEDTDGASFNIEVAGDFFDIDSTDFPLNNFRIHRNAPSNAVVVTTGIGIGTSAPTADLDILDIDGNGVTEYRFQSGGATWRNGVPSSTGVFQFTKIGTGGAEFLVRERNHAVATVDVDGPVKASQFKVSSDRNLKTDVAPIDGDSVLEKLNNLPISSWEFKACKAGEGRLEDGHGRPPKPCTGEGTGQRHIGPMAQDFQRQFGLGDGESISLTDANGIMMASLQALTRQLEERDATIAAMQQQLQEREAANAAMQQQLSDLEARMDGLEAQERRGGSPKG